MLLHTVTWMYIYAPVQPLLATATSHYVVEHPDVPLLSLSHFFNGSIPNQYTVTIGAKGQILRHPISVWYLKSSLDDEASPVNQPIQVLTANIGQRCRWAGVVIAARYGNTRMAYFSHVTDNDLEHLAAFFSKASRTEAQEV